MKRDIVAEKLANWVINTFASKQYRNRLAYVYAVGIAELDKQLERQKEQK